MSEDSKPDQPDQDELLLPDGWHVWETRNAWHVRPPGPPDPYKYLHGSTKQEVADKAWAAHRRASSVKRGRS